jgi:hypothetical protein
MPGNMQFQPENARFLSFMPVTLTGGYDIDIACLRNRQETTNKGIKETRLLGSQSGSPNGAQVP